MPAATTPVPRTELEEIQLKVNMQADEVCGGGVLSQAFRDGRLEEKGAGRTVS